ncbi:hypothetical protein EOL71_03765 [Candidatus Saccharibacteria bacterium]|nr:hypothetical protein [Candidatus Saccharibacteria bacterium]
MARYSEINGLLNERLSSIDDLPFWSRENQYLEPEDDDLYIKSRLVSADSQNPFIGAIAPTYESGTFIVSVCSVRGTSWGYAYEWVDKIVEQFKRGTVLTTSAEDLNLRIKKSFPVNGFFGENGRYIIPIHIEYFVYVEI